MIHLTDRNHEYIDDALRDTTPNLRVPNSRINYNCPPQRKHETYERLAEESTEGLECEIVAIKRSAGADPRHRKD